MYKAIFFDLDDTLWSFSRNAEESFKEVYEKFRLNRYFNSFGHFYSLYLLKNKELWNAYGRGEINRSTLNTVRFQYPLEQVGIVDDILVYEYSSEFFRLIQSKSTLESGAKELLTKLYPKYPLYIISNGFEELQYKKMQAAGIDSYFEGVILSDVVGYNKPHSAIFQYALSKANIKASQALMIGDNWLADIEGAKRCGIDQIYYANEKIEGSTFYVSHLSQIEDILV